jgi:hypothetical protein
VASSPPEHCSKRPTLAVQIGEEETDQFASMKAAAVSQPALTTLIAKAEFIVQHIVLKA